MEDNFAQYNYLAKDAMNDLCSTEGFPTNLKGKLEDMIKHVLPPRIYQFTNFLLPRTYQMLHPEASNEDIKMACKLSWMFQMYQTYDYVIDDDFEGNISSEIRGELRMLEGVNNRLLRKHFSKLGTTYYQLVNLFLECSYDACKANRAEAQRTLKNLKRGIIPRESFDVETYSAVAYLKGAPIHFYLPVALAMTLAGDDVSDNRDKFEKVKKIFFRLGNFFQCIEDYYDSFSGDAVNGAPTKDTDIRKGQFNWVFLTVKEHCPTEDDWETLKENYGKDNDESVAVVKALYEKINVPKLFTQFKVDEYKGICEETSKLLGTDDKIGKVVKGCAGSVLKVFATTPATTGA